MINKQFADFLLKELTKKAKELSEEKLTVKCSGSYLEGEKINVTIKFNAKEINGIEKSKHDWDGWAWLYGIHKDWYGKTVNVTGAGPCIIRGIKPKAKKYPIIVEKISNGKRYKCNQTFIKENLELEPK